MSTLHLSKSRFCSAIQCPKMLWLMQNRPEQFDNSVMDENILNTGTEVGRKARELFGHYTEIPFGDLKEMVERTKVLINNGEPVIAEASFADDENFCSVDVLLNKGSGKVEIYEVKSSTEVKDIYLYDVAYQYHVLSSQGYDVEKACLVYINNKYVRHGDLDLNELLRIDDLTEQVRGMQDEVCARIDELRDIMAQSEEPTRGIEAHCFNPYSCGFFKYCTKDWPHPNIFDIASLQNRSRFKLMKEGILSFEDVEAKNAVKPNYMLQVKHELHNQPDEINVDGIKAYMDTLSYPLYFLDFESFQPAIPLFDDSKPYEQIVFQYSLHYILEEGGELLHKEFLAYPGDDPRKAVAEHLVEDIPEDVCTLAYNMGFEKGRISGLAELYPDLREHLLNIKDNIKDLMIPFRQKDYYNKAMQGSYSIKYVLPALFPDDPELDYHNLEGVHNGTEASASFAEMADMEPDKLEKYREYLLKYCGLDTYAMVKVWEKLKEVISL